MKDFIDDAFFHSAYLSNEERRKYEDAVSAYELLKRIDPYSAKEKLKEIEDLVSIASLRYLAELDRRMKAAIVKLNKIKMGEL